MNVNSIATNKTNFNSMYGVGNYWNKTYDSDAERNNLNYLYKRLDSDSVRYKKNDGLTYKFDLGEDSLYYTNEKTHMMSNVKLVCKDDEDSGFYAINDGKSADTVAIFALITAKLNNILAKVRGTDVEAQQVLKNKKPATFIKNFK